MNKNQSLKFFLALVLNGLMSSLYAADPQTIPHVVEKALQSSPDFASAQLAERAGQARVRSAKAGFYPRLNLGMGRGYEWTRSTVLKQDKLHRQENDWSVSQTVFDGFATRNRVKAQQALVTASEFTTLTRRDEVALRAIEALLNVYLSQRLIKMAEENVQMHVKTLKKANAVFEAGAAHKGDMKLVAGRLALAEATYARISNELADALANYEAAVGEPFAGAVPRPKVPDRMMPGSLKSALIVAKLRNPLLRSAQATIASNQATTRAARAAFLPTATLDYTTQNNANLDGVKGESRDRMLMLNVSFNLLNGGADWGAWREAQQLELDSQQAYERTERALLRQVKTDWNLWQISNARLFSLKAHQEASAAVLQSYQKEFHLGKRQLYNILDQENELFRSKTDHERGQVDLVRSAYRLLTSMGQLFEQVALLRKP